MAKKRQERTILRAKLDEYVSKFVRLTNADEYGYCYCVTCGCRKHWKEIQAGHFITRGKNATRWDLKNIHCQCFTCNVRQNGNYPKYAEYLIATYGPEHIAILNRRARKITKEPGIKELRALVEQWKEKVEALPIPGDC